MAECNENDLEICRFRADTLPVKRRLTQDGSPTVVDITGFSFLLTVNTVKNPSNASPEIGTELFQIAATLTNPTNGQFQFDYVGSPQGPELLDPGNYFYDMQMTDVGGVVRTIAKGKYTIKQDITK